MSGQSWQLCRLPPLLNCLYLSPVNDMESDTGWIICQVQVSTAQENSRYQRIGKKKHHLGITKINWVSALNKVLKLTLKLAWQQTGRSKLRSDNPINCLRIDWWHDLISDIWQEKAPGKNVGLASRNYHWLGPHWPHRCNDWWLKVYEKKENITF